MTRRVVLLLLPAAVAAGLLAAAYGRAKGPGPGEAALAVDGTAVVVRADGSVDEVTTVTLLRRGDRATLVEGLGWLELAGGTRMAARAAGAAGAGTAVLMDRVPTLLAGDLLVEAGDRLTVDTGRATVDLAGSAAQVRRSYTTAVAVYSGAATVGTAGREMTVPALREAHVPAPGRLPARPRPLHFDGDDPWDDHFLGEAVALGEELRQRVGEYTAGLPPGEGRTPGFFALLVPPLEDEPAFGRGLLEPDRGPGETLLGAAIAVLGERGPFTERWGEVFDFRDQGAAWGLVAMDQRVDADPLRATIEQALNATSYQFAAPSIIAARRAAAAGAAVTVGPDGTILGTVPGGGGTGPGGSPGGTGGTGPGGTDGTVPGGTGPGGTDGPGTTGPGGGGGPGPSVTTVPTTGLPTSTSGVLPSITTTTVRLPTTLPSVTTTTIRLPTTLPSITTTTIRLPTTLPPITTTTIRLPTTLPPITTTSIRLPTSTTLFPLRVR